MGRMKQPRYRLSNQMGVVMSTDRDSSTGDWPTHERRDGGRLDPDVIRLIERRVSFEVERGLDAALTKHAGEIAQMMAQGFPGGDPDGHRRYHEEQIAWMEERRKMYASIREKTLTALVWAVIVAICTGVWEILKMRFGVPPSQPPQN